MVSSVLGSGLEGELEEELGYSKYDYRNKETDNSRNGHTEKSLKSSVGEIELSVPRDRNGEFEPQLVKKYQTSLSQDIEEKNNLHVRQGNDDRRYREAYPRYIRHKRV